MREKGRAGCEREREREDGDRARVRKNQRENERQERERVTGRENVSRETEIKRESKSAV